MIDKIKNPEYTPDTMLAFIDILGFKELLDNKGLPEIVETIENILNTDNSPEYVKMLKIKTELISDSFVIFAQLTDSAHLTAFFVYLGTVIGRIHRIGNIITRGFVSNGNHYSTDKLWISPVFVAAYNGEQKKAVHPRVIIGDSAIRQINRLESSFINLKYFNQDTDGFRYVNYLAFISEAYQPNGTNITANLATPNLRESLNSHKQTIINGLDNHKPHINKYYWLANYHNNYINDNIKLENKQELLINLTKY